MNEGMSAYFTLPRAVEPSTLGRALASHSAAGELCVERLRFALGSEASLRNLPPVVPQRPPSAVCEAMLGEALD